jgi:hypothetical protein
MTVPRREEWKIWAFGVRSLIPFFQASFQVLSILGRVYVRGARHHLIALLAPSSLSAPLSPSPRMTGSLIYVDKSHAMFIHHVFLICTITCPLERHSII